jgi:lambda repressor-like predicted transcriptional regulator
MQRATLAAWRTGCHRRRVSRRRSPAVVNHLPDILRRRGVSWGQLARRTLLPSRLLARLRDAHANPRLAVAERVALALGVPVETIWRLRR